MVKKDNTVKNNPSSLEPVLQVWGWVLLIWSLYRYFFKFSEPVDELIFKPLIFILPVLFFLYRKEKRKIDSLGIGTKNLFQSLYAGIFFGFIFAFEGIMLNYFKNGKLIINPIDSFRDYGLLFMMFLSLATALSEEILNRGFLFNRIFEKTRNLVYSASVATLLFVLLHVPILVTSLQFQGATLIFFFLSIAMMGFLNNLLFYHTQSIVAPILVHIFWNMTVALYF